MKIIDNIENTINRLPKGYIFTYSDFITEVNNQETIIKSLNRLSKTGKILKLSKGKFYKPEKSVFGNLLPQQYQIVKDLLENDGKLVGYLTGFSIFNNLGLTTQISNIIQIGKKEIRSSFTRGMFKISFIKQKNTITKDNIPLLQILDSIKLIKKIPDTSTKKICERLIELIKNLNEEDTVKLIKYSKQYPPATRALMGSFIDDSGKEYLTEPLLKTLNPISTYKFEGISEELKSSNKWRLK
jgi:hypothetical protein